MIDIQYTATKNNVHIVDSYKCKKRDFGDILTGIIVYNAALQMPQTHHYSDEWIVWIADSIGIIKVHTDPITFSEIEKGQYVIMRTTK